MQRLIILSLALALSACAASTVPPPAASPAAVPQISVETMKEVTRTLSGDDFEGRAPGTAGEQKTLAYLVEKFQAAGLQPGNKGSWFQDVPLVEITGANHSPLTIGELTTSVEYLRG